MTKKIVVVGLGEVGGETYTAIQNRLTLKGKYTLTGVDLSKQQRERFHGDVVEKLPHDGDIYLVSVFSVDQVFAVMSEIETIYKSRPGILTIVESTIAIEDAASLQSFGRRDGYGQLAICPHRFNPGDPAHGVFNLTRVLGAIDTGSYDAACEFYMDCGASIVRAPDLMHAMASKLLENSYRFAEIVLAQEFNVHLRCLRLNAETVRELANTKWNINILEPRAGVGGKCLPKDIGLLNRYHNTFLQSLIDTNNQYKIYYEQREKAMRKIDPVTN